MAVELEPFFQPIIDVNNGLIAYNEVLARKKRQDTGRYVSAGAIFSSPALSLNQILRFDKQVRFKAFEKYKTYDGDAHLSINISPNWFNEHAPFLKLAEHEIPTLSMLNDCGIDPQRIVIELTEYAGDKALIQHFVNAYRKMGAKIAIDDFGTGFSQIDRLIEIEPDIIKLDMSLFQRSLISNYTLDLIKVIASFAKKTHSELIFEGIETIEQYKIAVDSGADLVQGYLFSQAKPEFFQDNHFAEKIKTLSPQKHTILSSPNNHEDRAEQWRNKHVSASSRYSSGKTILN
ncbi:EAL domain-containing protein [Psychromonas sp. PT13]|uniref:EAL domain-containing protein n=1 Tax=Psychromonas sp. PT13 TaxID=3439547 RepID=UPI003EC02C15